MSEHQRRAKARAVLAGAGYRAGGHLKGEKKMVKSAISQHETQEHEGHHSRIRLADGGACEGLASGGRADKMSRGGHKKKSKHAKVQVNVIVPHGGAAPTPAPTPVPVPVRAPMAGSPPVVPSPGGGPPVGLGAPAGPPRPPGMLKRGGKVKFSAPELTGGAGGGLGRLEKAEHEAKQAGGKR